MHRLEILKQTITSSEPSGKIQVEKKDEVATVYLTNPKELNALSIPVLNEIADIFTKLNYDKEVKLIILRSKVPKIFCAGANIKSFQQRDLAAYPDSLEFRNFSLIMRSLHKPVISVIEGKALGGGFELALLTDIIVCSDKAQFGLPEITLGIMPGIGGTQILPRIVGEKVAMRMILTGLPISAQEAHRLNVAHLLPSETFEAELGKIIQAITSKAGEALFTCKRAIKGAFETTLDQGLEHESSLFHSLFNKPCAKEGIGAFVEKRKPNFKGL